MIVNQNHMIALQHAEFLENNRDESGFKNIDVSMSNENLLNYANRHSSLIHIDNNDVMADDSHTFSKDSNHYHHNSTADISIISID